MSVSSQSGTAWIAVDWGTSRLRAWAIGEDGSPLIGGVSDRGMGSLAPEEFEGALLELAGPWLPEREKTEVVIGGMAGARQGWKEAPYRTVPCEPVSPGALVPVETRDDRLDVRIVPGLCQIDPPDVMRGEETQLAGLCAAEADFDGMVCLPGTHSKWTVLKGGVVQRFSTFMTGELYGLLADRSVLRHTVSADGWDEGDFVAAVREAAAEPLSVHKNLFALRAGPLLEAPPAASLRARLSGLLIGAEIAAMRCELTGGEVAVIGDGRIARSYRSALTTLGIPAVLHDAESLTLAGLAAARGSLGAGT